MAWTRAVLAVIVAGAVGAAVVSGGSSADPRTPAALPRLPPPFLGTAVVGGGGLTAAIDAYGDVVDLRAPGPVGRALIDNPADRQATGTVPADTGMVPRVRIGGAPALPLWRADAVVQRYLPGTNLVRTVARFGSTQVDVLYAARGASLACIAGSSAGSRVSIRVDEAAVGSRLRCNDEAARRIVHAAAASDRRWLSRARPLGPGAPAWGSRMYRRSLLTLRALTDRRSGAVAAGARDGWAYVWPRDAGTAALAYAAAGYRPEARRVARFLLGLDLGAGARFHGDGTAVAGREAQGDAAGWVVVAARATGLGAPPEPQLRRNRPDYQEGAPGRYVANAIAALAASTDSPSTSGPSPSRPQRELRLKSEFVTGVGVMREPDARAGLDSAAAWAVRPFALPALYPPARRTLLHLAGVGASGPPASRFGITPSEHWPGVDPWTAPTAWSAWSLAALAAEESAHPIAAHRDRRAALFLLADLRRAATPAGELPERVGARGGIATSTTPLAWSHAFAILALRKLWPSSNRTASNSKP